LILVASGCFYSYKFVYSEHAISVYHRCMAVVHISRSEAANNFEGILARAANGDEIHIESDARVIAKLLPGDPPKPRLLSDSLKILSDRGTNITLDGEFGRDLEEVIRGHREPLSPPSWD
jgi:antitoxin (DNA-binding transcriptional repressor) of toxin-antitoxin stability system